MNAIDLGRLDYGAARDIMLDLVNRRSRGEVPDTLILVEHDPVVTVGRGTPAGMSGPPGVPVFEVERGGGVTWHGPGQVVGYPIVNLVPRGRDVRQFLRDIEEVLIHAISDLGVIAGRRDGWTGVWAGDRKVASVGIAVRRWVTYHGFALNVALAPGSFLGIRPCGLEPEVYADLSTIVGRPVGLAEAREAVTGRFRELLGRALPV